MATGHINSKSQIIKTLDLLSFAMKGLVETPIYCGCPAFPKSLGVVITRRLRPFITEDSAFVVLAYKSDELVSVKHRNQWLVVSITSTSYHIVTILQERTSPHFYMRKLLT